MGDLLVQPLTWGSFLTFTVMAVLFLLLILGMVTYGIYFERKILGWMQLRPGPNRTGKLGLLQTVADVLKLLIKEDTIPSKADRPLFKIAPAISFVPSFVVLATIPYTDKLYFANLDIGCFIMSLYPRCRRSASCWGAGRPTTNMPCSAACVRRLS